MSKLVKILVTCPQCGHQYTADVFRSIWGDYGTADNNVLTDDKINIVECPICKYSFRLPLPFMYVDVVKGFAVWWEPNHDPLIDQELASYAEVFGADSFYALAPRIKEWNEFKATVRKYYTGELKANPIDLDVSAINFGKTPPTKKNKKRLLGVIIILAIIIAIIIFLN